MYFLLEASGSLMSQLLASTLPFVVVLAVMYFMLIAPQKKREKKRQPFSCAFGALVEKH